MPPSPAQLDATRRALLATLPSLRMSALQTETVTATMYCRLIVLFSLCVCVVVEDGWLVVARHRVDVCAAECWRHAVACHQLQCCATRVARG